MNDVVARRGQKTTVGGIAAALAAALLLLGAAGFAVGSDALRPWLAELFGINAGMSELTLASLEGIKLIDVAVLGLACLAFAGFWPGPGKPHKAWMVLAAGLPFAGIAVLAATGLWGRSGLMGGGLVLSILMMSSLSHRTLGVTGAAVNVLLLVGDFGTTGSRSDPLAVVVAVGYLALVVWFAWIALRLLPVGKQSSTEHLASDSS